MKDTIYRQDAIKAIDDLPNCYNGYSDTYDKACIIGVLEELPSAEKHGRWIKNQRKSIFHIEPVYICSCCREQEALGEMELSNYCPNCGARMRGEEDERSD